MSTIVADDFITIPDGEFTFFNTFCRIDADGGTPTLAESHNVTSLTDDGVGLYTINLTNAYSSSEWANISGAGNTGTNVFNRSSTTNTRATTSCGINSADASGVELDVDLVNFSGAGVLT